MHKLEEFDAAIEASAERDRRLSWIPVYGLWRSWAGERERARLLAEKTKLETELIVSERR